MFLKAVSHTGNVVYINAKTTHTHASKIKCDCTEECKAEFLENLIIIEITPAEEIARKVYETIENPEKGNLNKDFYGLLPGNSVDIAPICKELIRLVKEKSEEVPLS